MTKQNSELLMLLETISNKEIAGAVESSFSEIARHFALRNWKTSGLDAGHFVEAVRRILELKLLGTATPIGKSLPKFNESALKSYENASGDESYRILIPRLLFSLYALRNKRSIGHLGAVPASELDAALLLRGAQWVIAEIIRIEGGGSVEETRGLISHVTQHQTGIAWQNGDVTRILDPAITARNQVLLLLLIADPATEDALRNQVGYKNPTNFRKILKRLHDDRMIEHSKEKVVISPTGITIAEKIMAERNLL